MGACRSAACHAPPLNLVSTQGVFCGCHGAAGPPSHADTEAACTAPATTAPAAAAAAAAATAATAAATAGTTAATAAAAAAAAGTTAGGGRSLGGVESKN